MILLPRGIPLKEKVDPGRVNLPDALKKLHAGKFTGYLRFELGEGTGVVIFEKGRLISALFEKGREQHIAYDALALIFEQSLLGGGRLDIYRLSPDLAMSIHALLHGRVLYLGQELKLIDIRSLLGKLKEDAFSGCLRIYTDDHIALIFYRSGKPLGFFHDGSTEIEVTADTSMSVARLPGAKVDVLAAKGAEGLILADLMESADLAALWKKVQDQVAHARHIRREEAARLQEIKERERRQEMLVFLRKIAEQHLGKIGGSLVEKEFEKTSGAPGDLSEDALNGFYERIMRSARMVAGPSAVTRMLDEMKKGGPVQPQ